MTLAVAWAIAIVVAALVLVRRRYQRWRDPRTTRAERRRRQRRLLDGIVLGLVAIGTAAAIFSVLLGPPGSGLRGIGIGVAWGAFLGYQVLLITEPED